MLRTFRTIRNSVAQITQALQNARADISTLSNAFESNTGYTIRLSNIPKNLPRVLHNNLSILLQLSFYFLTMTKANRVHLATFDDLDHYDFDGHNITLSPGDCNLTSDNLQNYSYRQINGPTYWKSPEGLYSANLTLYHEEWIYDIPTFICVTQLIDRQIAAIQGPIDARHKAERIADAIAKQNKELVILFFALFGGLGLPTIALITYALKSIPNFDYLNKALEEVKEEVVSIDHNEETINEKHNEKISISEESSEESAEESDHIISDESDDENTNEGDASHTAPTIKFR